MDRSPPDAARSSALPGTPEDTIQAKSNETTSSPFLALPQELRNTIYESLSTNPRVVLSYRSRQPDAAPWQPWLILSPEFSSIALVNHQIFAEIQDLAHNSWSLHTMVIDYDFNHIISFTSELSDVQLAALVSRCRPAMRIKLIVTGDVNVGAGLTGWLEFLGDGRMRNCEIDFRYYTIHGKRHGARYGMEEEYERMVRSAKVLMIEQAVEMTGGGKRAVDEGEKMKRGIQEPRLWA